MRTITRLIPVLCAVTLLVASGCDSKSGSNAKDEPAAPATSQPEETSSAAPVGNSVDDSVDRAVDSTLARTGEPETAVKPKIAAAETANKPAVAKAESLGSEKQAPTVKKLPPSLSASTVAPTVPPGVSPDKSPKVDAAPEMQTVQISPAALDLGEIPTDDSKTGIVTLTNTGDTPRKVLDCKSSCGCTTANCQKGKVLEPGEKMEVEIKLSGGTRETKLSKTVTFLISDQAPIRLPVTAKAVAFVVADPAQINREQNPEGRIALRAVDGSPFSIKSMYPPVIEEFAAEPSVEHELFISWDKLDELGFKSAKVKLLFNIDHPKATKAFSMVTMPQPVRKVDKEATDRAGTRTPPFSQPKMDLDKLLSDGKTDEIIKLIESGEIEIDKTDKSGQTPLVKASRWGNPDVIQMLLDESADISVGDRIGRTPLMYASQSKNVESVLVLLDAGADIAQRDQIGNTALCWAAGFGDAATVKELVDAGAQIEISGALTGFTPLIWASGFGEPDSIKILIDAGANVEAADVLQGATPLMNAARTGGPDNVRMLLEAGADLEAKDNEGKTTLLIAASNAGPDAELVQMLVDAGADLKARTASGQTVLELARKRTDLRSEEVIKLLESLITDEELEASASNE